MGLLLDENAGAPYRQKTVSAEDGLQLLVRDYGDQTAPVVLCLCGLTRNAKDFHSLATTLCDRYRIISFDYRGNGLSDRNPGSKKYQVQSNVSDVSHVLTALNIEHCAVIGTSFGGLLGMVMGVAMPTRIVGLLLNDIAPAIPQTESQAIEDALNAPPVYSSWAEATQDLMTRYPDLSASDDADWMVIAKSMLRSRDDGKLVPDWDPRIVEILEGPPPDPAVMWAMYDSLRKRPVALLRGGRSRFLNDDIVAEMSDRRSALQVAMVEGVGHAPNLVESESQHLIGSWLAECF